MALLNMKQFSRLIPMPFNLLPHTISDELSFMLDLGDSKIPGLPDLSQNPVRIENIDIEGIRGQACLS